MSLQPQARCNEIRLKTTPVGHRAVFSGRKHAFTLIELLAVMAIITIITSMIIGVAHFARQKSLRARAIAEIERLHNVLQDYHLQNGTYPEALTGIEDRLPAGFDLLDPWEREYQYAKQSDYAYTLFSHGPKESITADDISTGR